MTKIGTMVHYFDSFGPYDVQGGAKRCTAKPAIVTFTYSSGHVDLTIFQPGRKGIQLKVDVERVDGDVKEGRWDYPPNEPVGADVTSSLVNDSHTHTMEGS